MAHLFERLDRAYLALFREYPPLVGLAVVTGAGQAAFALLNVYALPTYLLRDLRVSGLAAGAVAATFLLCETVLKFPLGRLSDNFGRRPFIVLGPLLICINPMVVVLLPTRLWALVFPLRVLDGAGAAALWPPLYALVGDMVRDRSRAAAMSVLNTVYVAAIGVAAALGAFVAHLTGSNRTSFFLASVFLLCSGLVAHFAVPRGAAGPGRPAAGEVPRAPAGAVPATEAPPVVACPLSLVLVISLLMTLGVLVLSTFLVVYLQVDLGLSALQIGLLLVGLGVPVALLGLPLGHAADRWGKARAVRLSFAVSALLMWLVPSCRSLFAFAAVATVLVVAHILGTPAWLALVSQLAPDSRRGGVMGMVATAEGLGAALGPVLGGWLWDIHHTWVFYGSASLLTLGALLALCAVRQEVGVEA